MTESQVQP